MRYYCTYFDANYLVKGLALYRSLARHAGPFRLWVLCLDERTLALLRGLALPDLEPIALADLETGDAGLLAAKANRSRIEYYFTCTSSLVLYILRGHPEVDLLSYLDADLYFFAGPEPIEAELGAGSILIIGHRFPPRLRRLESRGIYNVGYLSFRRDATGLACLAWWRARCLEWCYDREEDGRFADQKYLDRWPQEFPGVVVLQAAGAGLAPWNMANYRYSLVAGRVQVDGQPLVFVHFHGLKQIGSWLCDPRLAAYGVRSGRIIRRGIYGPYLRELWDISRWLANHMGPGVVAVGSMSARLAERPLRYGSLSRAARYLRGWLERAARLARGENWLVLRGKVI